MAITPLTPEQMALVRQKAYEARQRKLELKEATKHLLKTHYLDKPHWAELASKYVDRIKRMPSTEEAVDVHTIRKYLKRCGIEVETWNEHYTNMKFFVEKNPTWTKYAAVGLILELKEEYEGKGTD
jgi:hypothetical protein